MFEVATPAPSTILEAEPATFGESYGQRPFLFGHHLADHPLFHRERLLQLAEEMIHIPNGLVYNSTQVGIGQRWDQTPKPKRDVVETLRNIETSDAWILLKRADHIPEYRELLEACLDEMQQAYGKKISNLIKYRNCSIFISSPRRVTNYHIDREWNCLLQIAGTKTLKVFDRTDRDVLPEEEIERFWTIDNNSAVWKPQFEDRAQIFELAPGRGLHIPINSPHWVQNGPDVSISMSANFHLHDALLGYVYRTNYWMRRIGLRPSPPGRSKWLDAAKGNGYATVRNLGNRLRRRPKT